MGTGKYTNHLESVIETLRVSSVYDVRITRYAQNMCRLFVRIPRQAIGST